MNNLTLEFTEYGIKSKYNGISGNTLYKNISLETLKNVLNKDIEFDTGFLNLYGPGHIGIKRYIKSGSREILFIEAAPAIRIVEYENKKYNVPYPGLLMAIISDKSIDGLVKVKNSLLYSTIGPIFRDSDELYLFPFANVYSGIYSKICWGQVDLRPFNTIQKASGLMQVFLTSIMNNDLYRSNDKFPETRILGGFLESLNDKSEFNIEYLKKADINFKGLLEYTRSKNACSGG